MIKKTQTVEKGNCKQRNSCEGFSPIYLQVKASDIEQIELRGIR